MSRIPTVCPLLTAIHYNNLETPSLKLETEQASTSMTNFSGKVSYHSFFRIFMKLFHSLPENLQQTQ